MICRLFLRQREGRADKWGQSLAASLRQRGLSRQQAVGGRRKKEKAA